MNASKPNINWKKVASVTPGGKKHFYVGSSGALVVWNREIEKYQGSLGAGRQKFVVGDFDSVTKAKKEVERYFLTFFKTMG